MEFLRERQGTSPASESGLNELHGEMLADGRLSKPTNRPLVLDRVGEVGTMPTTGKVTLDSRTIWAPGSRQDLGLLIIFHPKARGVLGADVVALWALEMECVGLGGTIGSGCMGWGELAKEAWEIIPVVLLLIVGGAIAVRSGVTETGERLSVAQVARNVSQIALRLVGYMAVLLMIQYCIGLRPTLGW